MTLIECEESDRMCEVRESNNYLQTKEFETIDHQEWKFMNNINSRRSTNIRLNFVIAGNSILNFFFRCKYEK